MDECTSNELTPKLKEGKKSKNKRWRPYSKAERRTFIQKGEDEVDGCSNEQKRKAKRTKKQKRPREKDSSLNESNDMAKKTKVGRPNFFIALRQGRLDRMDVKLLVFCGDLSI